MFNLREYILKLLDESIGKEPDYKVRENALKWHERGTLVEADLEAVDDLIEERKKHIEKQTEEEIVDEIVENLVEDMTGNEQVDTEESSSVEEVIEENKELEESAE